MYLCNVCTHFWTNCLERHRKILHFPQQPPRISWETHGCHNPQTCVFPGLCFHGFAIEKPGVSMVFPVFPWVLSMCSPRICNGFPVAGSPVAGSPVAGSRTARWWRRRSSARCCRCSRSPAAMRPSASWTAKRRRDGEMVRWLGNHRLYMYSIYIYVCRYM